MRPRLKPLALIHAAATTSTTTATTTTTIARQIVHKMLHAGMSSHPDFENLRGLGTTYLDGSMEPHRCAAQHARVCVRVWRLFPHACVHSRVCATATTEHDAPLTVIMCCCPAPRHTPAALCAIRWTTYVTQTDQDQTRSEWIDTDIEMETKLNSAYDEVGVCACVCVWG
jgi:hypothetical protein